LPENFVQQEDHLDFCLDSPALPCLLIGYLTKGINNTIKTLDFVLSFGNRRQPLKQYEVIFRFSK